MFLRRSLTKINKLSVNEGSFINESVNITLKRWYRLDIDHEQYFNSSDGNEVRFKHEYLKRPMQSYVYRQKIIPKQKFVPEAFYSLKERLSELDPKLHDPELHQAVNIGFSIKDTEHRAEKRKRQRRILSELKNNKELQKQAKDLKLRLDVSAVQKEWLSHSSPVQTNVLATHVGIFRDLFGPFAYFNAVVSLAIEYDYNEDEYSPVFRGNIIKPREAQSPPSVGYSSSPDALWTLKLTNPDGDLYKKDSECIHWLVTNIKGNDISTGDVLVPYLPPVPPRGVGYQRMVFVLYRQTEGLQNTEVYRISDPHDLRLRSFSTLNFYKANESALTPAGLAWFNTDWDSSLTKYFHEVLGMKEPLYEYEFPGPYIKPEEVYPPHPRDFVTFLDLYRDQKEIKEEMLLKRLKHIHPFKKETTLPYPHTVPIHSNQPSWLRQEIKRERLGWGKYKELRSHDYDTTEDNDEALSEAAEIEVEKRHMGRLGEEWKKINVGIKTAKRKAEALRAANAKTE